MFECGDEVIWNDEGIEIHGNSAVMPLIIEEVFACDDDEYGDRYLLNGVDKAGNELTFIADESQLEPYDELLEEDGEW